MFPKTTTRLQGSNLEDEIAYDDVKQSNDDIYRKKMELEDKEEVNQLNPPSETSGKAKIATVGSKSDKNFTIRESLSSDNQYGNYNPAFSDAGDSLFPDDLANDHGGLNTLNKTIRI